MGIIAYLVQSDGDRERVDQDKTWCEPQTYWTDFSLIVVVFLHSKYITSFVESGDGVCLCATNLLAA